MIYRIENINTPKYTDSLYEKAYSEMAPSRKEKADRYEHIADKKLCVFSDMLLREMLKDNFGIENPEFYIDKSGKPCLLGDRLHFSISHSGCFIACAVDTTPVGIDIETPRPVTKKVIGYCCTEKEKNYIFSETQSIPDFLSPDSIETRRFLSLWTAKESYLKLTGEGLGGGLKNIVTVENYKLKSTINNKKLLTITEKDYVMSVISEST